MAGRLLPACASICGCAAPDMMVPRSSRSFDTIATHRAGQPRERGAALRLMLNGESKATRIAWTFDFPIAMTVANQKRRRWCGRE
jgi:hypothetical protein